MTTGPLLLMRGDGGVRAERFRQRRMEAVPEAMLERFIGPVGKAILQVSAAARRLQHGRLQACMLYLAASLAGMGILVWLGGKP
jgi:hypothetical protein